MLGVTLSDNRDAGDSERLERALETIDQSKRDSMRKMIAGAAFAAPIVISFAIDGLTVGPAMAIGLNGTHS